MLESVSLEIANHWSQEDFVTEVNKNCGTLVAFDWVEDFLADINTNIDLSELEVNNFKFDTLVDFLKKNNFTFVLGLRNITWSEKNPSPEWTDKLKEILKSNDIDYDEYIVQVWPSPVPEFDVPDNIFILRYSYDEYSKIDQLASSSYSFKSWIEESDWEKYYKNIKFEKKSRVVVFVSDIENLILHERYVK